VLTYSRTANPWISDSYFFDPSYYKSALQQNNIWRQDYHLARVFNTPSYCNHLLQDLHGQIETSELDRYPILETEVSSRSIDYSFIKKIMSSIVQKIYEIPSEKEIILANKGLAWFLISTNLITSVEESDIPTEVWNYVNNLYSVRNTGQSTILFADLITICGNRSQGEKSRTLIHNIINSLL